MELNMLLASFVLFAFLGSVSRVSAVDCYKCEYAKVGSRETGSRTCYTGDSILAKVTSCNACSKTVPHKDDTDAVYVSRGCSELCTDGKVMDSSVDVSGATVVFRLKQFCCTDHLCNLAVVQRAAIGGILFLAIVAIKLTM